MNVPPGHWFEEMRAADDDIGDAGSQLMVSLLVVSYIAALFFMSALVKWTWYAAVLPWLLAVSFMSAFLSMQSVDRQKKYSEQDLHVQGGGVVAVAA